MMMLVNKDKRREFEIMKAEQKIKKLEGMTLKMKEELKRESVKASAKPSARPSARRSPANSGRSTPPLQ